MRFSIPIFWQAAQFWKKELMNGSDVLALHTHGREIYISTERITELLLFFICLKIGSFVCGLPLSSMAHPPTPCTINETGKKSTGSAQSHSVASGTRRAPTAAVHCQSHVLRTAQKPHMVTKPIKRGSEKASPGIKGAAHAYLCVT